jgi:hypothetical protein
VIDFRRSRRPRNYLSRREQWRLLLLVMSLGLVMVLMSQARDPRNWAWLVALGDRGKGEPSTLVPAADAPLEDAGRQKPPKLETPGTSQPPGPAKTEDEATARYFPGVEPKYLAAIRDDATFRLEEQDAWFQLLEILDRTDQAALQRGSTGRVTYSQLSRQSEQYRGQLVTIRGTIRRTSLQRPQENGGRIDQYYQTVLQPAEDRSQLIFVYCLYLPEGFPTGLDVSADVDVTGFHFKRWTYAAQDTVRTAPVLLARTVDWIKPAAEPRRPSASVTSVLTWIAVSLCVSLLLAAYVYTRTRRSRPRQPAAPPQFEALRDAPIASGPPRPWEGEDRREPGP